MDGRIVAGVAVRECGDPADPGILLWPGLGSTGGYFAGVAGGLPGRVVVADPPGFGRSPAWTRYTYARLVEVVSAVFTECGCWACVGHSLGAYLGVGLASRPPAGLGAVVLIDGGFLDRGGLAEIGMPATAGRAQLAGWLRENTPSFSSWEAAVRGLAAMVGGEVSPELETYAREVLADCDGVITDPTPPERLADLVLAVVQGDVVARARAIAVPTLLIACGQPAERRVSRERAWQALADASPLVELRVADDWGHNAILQDPAASASLIGSWLRAHL